MKPILSRWEKRWLIGASAVTLVLVFVQTIVEIRL